MQILLIEDDPETASFVSRGLEEAGHKVQLVTNGKDGVILGIQEMFDLVILERVLPGLDGLSVVKSLRSSGRSMPILFLTTLDGTTARIEGLDAGGDDYLAKPFDLQELLARVHALGRRLPIQEKNETLTVADLTINVVQRSVARGSKKINLRHKEYLLLEMLVRNEGKVVARAALLERIWGPKNEHADTIVETYISRLRAKVDKGFDIPLIHTVRGYGYCIHAPEKPVKT